MRSMLKTVPWDLDGLNVGRRSGGFRIGAREQTELKRNGFCLEFHAFWVDLIATSYRYMYVPRAFKFEGPEVQRASRS